MLPTPGEVTTEFGVLDLVTYTDGWHTGIDIADPLHTPITSPADGTALLVRTVSGRGLTLSVQSGSLVRRYCHLSDSDPIAHPGDSIAAGDIIAYVGLTGYTTGPHLHYETFLDPLALETLLGHLDVLWGLAVLADNLAHHDLAHDIFERVIAIKKEIGL